MTSTTVRGIKWRFKRTDTNAAAHRRPRGGSRLVQQDRDDALGVQVTDGSVQNDTDGLVQNDTDIQIDNFVNDTTTNFQNHTNVIQHDPIFTLSQLATPTPTPVGQRGKTKQDMLSSSNLLIDLTDFNISTDQIQVGSVETCTRNGFMIDPYEEIHEAFFTLDGESTLELFPSVQDNVYGCISVRDKVDGSHSVKDKVDDGSHSVKDKVDDGSHSVKDTVDDGYPDSSSTLKQIRSSLSSPLPLTSSKSNNSSYSTFGNSALAHEVIFPTFTHHVPMEDRNIVLPLVLDRTVPLALFETDTDPNTVSSSEHPESTCLFPMDEINPVFLNEHDHVNNQPHPDFLPTNNNHSQVINFDNYITLINNHHINSNVYPTRTRTRAPAPPPPPPPPPPTNRAEPHTTPKEPARPMGLADRIGAELKAKREEIQAKSKLAGEKAEKERRDEELVQEVASRKAKYAVGLEEERKNRVKVKGRARKVTIVTNERSKTIQSYMALPAAAASQVGSYASTVRRELTGPIARLGLPSALTDGGQEQVGGHDRIESDKHSHSGRSEGLFLSGCTFIIIECLFKRGVGINMIKVVLESKGAKTIWVTSSPETICSRECKILSEWSCRVKQQETTQSHASTSSTSPSPTHPLFIIPNAETVRIQKDAGSNEQGRDLADCLVRGWGYPMIAYPALSTHAYQVKLEAVQECIAQQSAKPLLREPYESDVGIDEPEPTTMAKEKPLTEAKLARFNDIVSSGFKYFGGLNPGPREDLNGRSNSGFWKFYNSDPDREFDVVGVEYFFRTHRSKFELLWSTLPYYGKHLNKGVGKGRVKTVKRESVIDSPREESVSGGSESSKSVSRDTKEITPKQFEIEEDDSKTIHDRTSPMDESNSDATTLNDMVINDVHLSHPTTLNDMESSRDPSILNDMTEFHDDISIERDGVMLQLESLSQRHDSIESDVTVTKSTCTPTRKRERYSPLDDEERERKRNTNTNTNTNRRSPLYDDKLEKNGSTSRLGVTQDDGQKRKKNISTLSPSEGFPPERKNITSDVIHEESQSPMKTKESSFITIDSKVVDGFTPDPGKGIEKQRDKDSMTENDKYSDSNVSAQERSLLIKSWLIDKQAWRRIIQIKIGSIQSPLARSLITAYPHFITLKNPRRSNSSSSPVHRTIINAWLVWLMHGHLPLKSNDSTDAKKPTLCTLTPFFVSKFDTISLDKDPRLALELVSKDMSITLPSVDVDRTIVASGPYDGGFYSIGCIDGQKRRICIWDKVKSEDSKRFTQVRFCFVFEFLLLSHFQYDGSEVMTMLRLCQAIHPSHSDSTSQGDWNVLEIPDEFHTSIPGEKASSSSSNPYHISAQAGALEACKVGKSMAMEGLTDRVINLLNDNVHVDQTKQDVGYKVDDLIWDMLEISNST
ncbi:hypothetical protein TREMEDRAFT_66314 [Tremella mesenterica DSM 1558]|uniref:uncharacterized protein n=1 Tax=Tremella mesenterica (strain ATCC 24925 / CBS 8224 / DSM 1558 / NBRC 9311 / NRRL Y-6157 / RJB 2259-6 / UBC 559-6) TaxID=578456 RepID=UPI00032C10A2|nr:uncharacterized protein TREMEDRAFT_66314 [Tremella mesenterica DSM 1558]EIW65717.1 hypothetical protein TREMEDRAFT_66314 [Tremella mesenterica DSM 1558]